MVTIVCKKTSRLYRREEDDEIINWFKNNSIMSDFCFRKFEGVWHDFSNFPQESKILNALPSIESQYQRLLLPKPMSQQPQYRLVSRGQSFKTGEEVIELHVYNQSRGIWTKMPMKVTIFPQCCLTLAEIEAQNAT